MFDHWRLKVKSHARSVQRIRNFVPLHATTEWPSSVATRHLVAEKSFRWVLWRERTRLRGLAHIMGREIDLSVTPVASIDMVDHGLQSKEKIFRFIPFRLESLCILEACSAQVVNDVPPFPMSPVALVLSRNISCRGRELVAWKTKYTDKCANTQHTMTSRLYSCKPIFRLVILALHCSCLHTVHRLPWNCRLSTQSNGVSSVASCPLYRNYFQRQHISRFNRTESNYGCCDPNLGRVCCTVHIFCQIDLAIIVLLACTIGAASAHPLWWIILKK